MKKFSILLAFLAAGLFAGCNTMQGAGKDIERGGEKLQQSAKDTKDKM
jgi:entericidin B